jgi:hypothetical protein
MATPAARVPQVEGLVGGGKRPSPSRLSPALGVKEHEGGRATGLGGLGESG